MLFNSRKKVCQKKCQEKGLIKQFSDGLKFSMRKADFDSIEVKHVLLVGGTCKIPFIRDVVNSLFDPKAIVPETYLNGLDSVCHGCTVVAYHKRNSGVKKKIRTKVDERINHRLGIEMDENKFEPLLNKEDIIPFKSKEIEVEPTNPLAGETDIYIFECYGRYTDDMGSIPLGVLKVSGIPKAETFENGEIKPRTIPTLLISMEIDNNYIFRTHVKIKDKPEKEYKLEKEFNNRKLVDEKPELIEEFRKFMTK